MVSKKGYYDMINDHVIDSDLKYLESQDIKKDREELKKNYLSKDELYKFEIYQLQKQVHNLQVRIKELTDELWEIKNDK
tara:strand:- start:2251 stop:2487 length:237 start_codon:yes stop_codon:yes gene_type:complete